MLSINLSRKSKLTNRIKSKGKGRDRFVAPLPINPPLGLEVRGGGEVQHWCDWPQNLGIHEIL